MEDKTILLKIELDTTSLTEGAKKAEENLKKLTPELEKIAKETGKNTLEYKKLNAEVKANQKTLTDNATALQKYEALQKTNNGSLKEMRSLLSASKVAYAELTKEERENAEVGGKLVKEMDALNEELLQAEKMYGTHTRNVGNYAGALTDLKSEIKSLKGQMATMDAGSEEYQQAAQRAGELNDKLKEVNENTKANTGGTGFEKMSNNLGLVKDDLMNLDFAGVSEKMKQMAVISKSMTFSEVIGGVKNMGSALVSFGKALLSNPLFLLVGAIVAIGAALFAWNNSVKKEAVDAQKKHVDALDKTFNAMLRNQEMAQKSRDLNIRLAELEGKDAKTIGEMRLKDQLKQLYDGYDQQEKNNERIRQLKKLALKQAEAGEQDEAKATQDKVVAIRESNRQLYANEQTFWKQRKILKLEIAEETKAEAEAEIEENKAKLERIRQANKTAFEERIALARKIRDLQLNELQLSISNERSLIEANYKFLEDTAQGNTEHLLDIERNKNNDLKVIDDKEKKQRLDKIKEDFDRQVTDAKGKDKLIVEINKLREEEIEAVDIEYKNKALERETTYNNKVTENQKLRAENERKTAEEIELIDAQLMVLKTKGTEQEIYAQLNLYRVKKKQLEEQAQLEIKAGKSKELAEKELQLKLRQLSDETFKKNEQNLKKETELTKEQKKDLAISVVNSAGQLADSLMQIGRNQIQTELNEDKEKYDLKAQFLDEQLQAGLISQAEFDAQKSVLESEYNAKQKELKEKQFKSNKASQLINATIATAVGVASALAAPPPLGLIMAGISGALGAAQIAIIASQPTPKFAKGGILNGASHSQGGINTPFGELEGGEAVINKNSTRLFSPLLSAINEAGGGVKFANGGILQPMTNAVDNQFQIQNTILQAIQSMPSPIVAVEEIVNAVGRRTAVVERANF